MPAESSILKGERVGGKGRRARERKRREQNDKREDKGEKKEKAHVLCYPLLGVDLTLLLGLV